MRHRGSAQRAGRWTAAASTLVLVLSAVLLVSVLHGHTRRPETVWSGRAHPHAAQPGRFDPGAVAREPTPAYGGQPQRRRPSSGGVAGRGRRETAPGHWRTVLAELDRRRAAAYAAADPAALRRVYVGGTVAMRQDRELLMRYRRRGLRVVGLRMRVLGVRVRARRRARVVLVVREQLAQATVRGAGTRRPVDGEVDAHVLTLRHAAGRGWRVASVRRYAGGDRCSRVS